MGLINSLLGSTTGPGGSVSGGSQTITTTTPGVTNVINAVNVFTIVVLIACGLLLTLFAVYIGYKMATAEDDKKRTDAKTHLIYAIVGLVSVIVIAVMLNAVIPAITAKTITLTANNANEQQALINILGNINGIVTIILKLITSAAVVFALYIGWKLMSAEDDAKRKNAKMQLIYTLVGVVGILVINMLASTVISFLIDNQKK